jgi:tetratricopeptide (TPR) repeat protein
LIFVLHDDESTDREPYLSIPKYCLRNLLAGGKSINQEPTVTLSIKESGERPNATYQFHILLDGKVLTSNQSLSLPDSQAVREISRSFGALFEQGCQPEMKADAQRVLGKQLFDLWLATSWEKIKSGVPVCSLRFLVIASEIPEILNLPWELLLPPDSDFLGINPLFRIRRFPSSARQMAPFQGELRARPLRLLFMACSPSDQPTLDYEREEEALFRAIYGQDVAFESCDQGTFEELKEKVSEFKPHVVHLTGHGAVLEGQGRFAFEIEDGTADLVPSEELRQFLAGSGVQCVFVSGCQSGKAPREALAGICQCLVGAEVPLAVGWAASIADDLATNFARTFYKTLKDDQPVDRALTLARQEAWKACEERGDPSWTLPVLYSATIQSMIFNSDPQKPVELPSLPTIVQEALPGMKEGYAEYFVGRRREQQRLLPALRRGDWQVVIITGLGGSGKSTLATRLARKLETSGFIPIPVASSKENPLNSARLLQAFADAFRKAARKTRKENASKADELASLAEDLNNPKISVESRLHDAVAALNEGRFLLLLDNFEANLDEADRHILDSEISGFYQHLLESLSGGSRIIITTRYPPSDAPVLPPKVHKEDLGDFPESSFLKILQRDPEVERRIRSGELPMALLKTLHKTFGGTPRFLLQIREAIKEMDAKLLEAELAKVELPTGTKPGELQKLRDKYFADIFTERLYGYLSIESQKALCRSAAYGVPVTMEGLKAVALEPLDSVRDFARSWQDRAFAYQETGKSKESLWMIYGLLRGWLLANLSTDGQKDARRAAGDFLVEMGWKDRESDLGLSWVDCLMEARFQYLRAGEIDLARKITSRLSDRLARAGFYDHVRQLNMELLDYEKHSSPMSWIAKAYFDQGEYVSAEIWYHRCEDASDISDPNLQMAIYGLASIEMKKGDYDQAREKFERVLKTLNQTGNRYGEAYSLHSLASIDFEKADYSLAREKFEKVLEIRQKIGDLAGEAATLHSLAMIDLKQGYYDQAHENFKKALEIRQQIGDHVGEGATMHAMASVDLRKGDYDQAREKFEKVLEIRQQIGDLAGEAATLHQMAMIDLNKGNYYQARDNFKKVLEFAQKAGDRFVEAGGLHGLASIDLNEGNYDRARENFKKALEIRQQIGNRAGEIATLHQLAMIDLYKGNYDLARENLKKALEIAQKIGNRVGEAASLGALASIDLKRGDYDQAHENFENSLKNYQHIGDRVGEASAFSQLGITSWHMGRRHEALGLIALGHVILAYLGHSYAKESFKNLSSAASQLGCSQEQFDALLKEVAEAYDKDHGQGLIDAAFPKA